MEFIQIWDMMCTLIVIIIGTLLASLFLMVSILMTGNKQKVCKYDVYVSYKFLGRKDLSAKEYCSHLIVEADYDINSSILHHISDKTNIDLDELTSDDYIIVYKEYVE